MHLNLSTCCLTPSLFAALQTLSDPDRRTLYDGLVGFAVDSINPFMDTSFPAEQVGMEHCMTRGYAVCHHALSCLYSVYVPFVMQLHVLCPHMVATVALLAKVIDRIFKHFL